MRAVMIALVVLRLGAEGFRAAPEVVANVSLLLARNQHVDCLQIFRKEHISLSETDVIYRIWKKLARVDSRLTTGVYSYKRYLEKKLATRRKVSCYRSLKVMSDDEGSKKGYAQFASKFSLVDAIWVLFTDTFSLSFFEEANVVFNDFIVIAEVVTEDLVVFHEVYRLKEGLPLKVLSFGKWTKAEGLMVREEGIFERRADLEGTDLTIGTVQNWPASYRRKNGQWDGFLIKVWNEIRTMINCSTVEIKEDKVVGVQQENGSWSGLVGMSLRGEIDVVVAEVILNKERARVMNCFHPVTKTSFQIYMKHLGYEWRWAAILKPLGPSVWAATVGWLVVGTVAWVFFFRVSLRFGLEGEELEQDGWLRPFLFVVQTMCQQGYHMMPKSYGCRVLFFVCYAVSSVLIPSYSASLVSTLSQKVHLKTFDTLEEMVTDGSYYLVVKENTAQHTFFAVRESTQGQTAFFQLAYEKLVKPVPDHMRKMGLRKSLQSLCHLDKYAVMGVEDMIEGRLHYLSSMDCSIVRLTHPVSTIYITMGTSKRSPFWGLINYHLGKLLMNGAVERLRRQEFPTRRNQPKEAELEVGIRQVASAFIFILFWMVASILILLLEIQYVFFKRHREKQKRKKHTRNLALLKSHLRLESKLHQHFMLKSQRVAPFPNFYSN